MSDSYTKKFVKIYFWQGISLVFNFLSLFIVLPYLTSQPAIYGIYSVCISVTVFLSYADLGFLGAGQKYAAEYFARGEINEEIRTIGFVSFVLLVFLVFLSLIFVFLSFHPDLLIKNLMPGRELLIASSLLLILALFTPVTLLQRLLQMIFGIRLEDYIVQRSNIIASLLKILSILWFFRDGQYNIVGYFLFVQIVNLLAAIVTLIIARRRFNYDFRLLIISMRFTKTVFSRTKNLAFTSLFLTISWILYYELDPLVIGKFIGAKQVAIYAIGFTLLSFFRTIFGILFSPFSNRFNHFIGVNDLNGLKLFILHVITIVAPLVIIPVLAVTLLARPLILSWVGVNYFDSIEISKFLILVNLFSFISYPTSMLLMAQERIKEMYIVNAIIPFIYWSGIILSYTYLGLKSFGVFKFISFFISAIVYSRIMFKFLDISMKKSLQEIFRPLFVPIAFLIIVSLFVVDLLPQDKSKWNLLIVASSIVLLMLTSLIIQYFTSSRIREYARKIFKVVNLNI